MPATTSLTEALEAWRRALGSEQVLTSERVQAYQASTLGVHRDILAVLRPQETSQVVETVQIASRYGVPLYPISQGRNWGYGSANPTVDGCVVVDLSDMTAIEDEDTADLGVITVGPGVTQRMLRDHLDARQLPYLVPVHGGGADCSLVGNALERGYGITPITDHFLAVTAVEVVLASGEVYRSPLGDMGAERVDRVFKWGVGPYLDGIFSQSNLGIVTRMTLALAPRPERIEVFSFSVRDHEELADATAAVRDILREVGGVTGSVNLMNDRRMLSMMRPYPTEEAPGGGIVPQRSIDRLARANRAGAWTGFGAMYGAAPVVKAARRLIRKRLRGTGKRLLFITPDRVSQIRRLLERLPRRGGEGLWNYVSTVDRSLSVVAGAPANVALPLAYWKGGTWPAEPSQSPNPARDGCGLIWYSPLVPMDSQVADRFARQVFEICSAHGIEPLITLTSLSERCFDSTIPLLFDPKDTQERDRAHACYEALLEAGRELGCVPYRSSIQHMDRFTSPLTPHWRLVSTLKDCLDPEHILAPGRYCPPPEQ